MKITLGNPAILLLLPVVVAVMAGTMAALQVKARKKVVRNLICHGIVAAFLLLALSNPALSWSNKTVTTIYVADLSDSTAFARSNMEEFISAAISQMPKDHQAGVISFGGDVRVEQFITDRKVFAGFNSSPRGDGTNIEEALTAAVALFPDDTGKRIVLLTDGMENEGTLENIVPSLMGSRIDVKVVNFLREEAGEVYVSHLDIPEQINIGDQFLVKIEVMSTRATTGVIYLYSGKNLKAQEAVHLRPGSNSFVFRDIHTEQGLKTYRAVVEAEDDQIIANNEYSAYTMAETAPAVLLVEGTAGQGQEFEKILRAGNINYQLATPWTVPDRINQMLEYQSVILLDVYQDDLKDGFMNGVESYVRDFGGGLIAIGGENSFALGNYRDTPLETVLPVYMDLKGEKEIPPIAFLIIIDRSGSMSDGNGYVTNLGLAKEAAVKALESLRPIDSIGVLSFDDSYTWTSEFADGADFDEVKRNILGITIGGGTSIYPALKVGAEALAGEEAPLKHIILLTDGQDGHRDYEAVLSLINEEGITFSTVSVGRDADTRLLMNLAERGNGRYYHTDLDTDIPRIFAQEVYLSLQSYLVNREFIPRVVGNHDIIGQIDVSALPPLYGYIAATKKEFAQEILVSDSGDPILTSWQYGLGRTVAFNSDGESKWTGAYSGWDEYVRLWKNIIEYTLSDVDGEGLSAAVRQEGRDGIITVKTDMFDGETFLSAVVINDDGQEEGVSLNPVSPGVYEGRFAVADSGVYSINLRKETAGELTGSLNTAFVTQYSREYRFMEEGADLQGFLTKVGGAFIETPQELLNSPVDRVKSRQSFSGILLILAVLLFFANIVVSRLHLERYLSKLFPGFELKQEKADKDKPASAKLPEAGKTVQPVKTSAGRHDTEIRTEPGVAKKAKEVQARQRKKKEPGIGKKEQKLDTSALLKKKEERDEQQKK